MKDQKSPNRRQFLGAAAVAAGAVGLESFAGRVARADRQAVGANQRARQYLKLHDEDTYANKIGSYSKGLPHNPDGTVVLSAYNALVHALSTGKPADFNAIPMGGQRRLTNPQCGLAFDSQGPNGHALVQPPAPAFASREMAAEIAENYWMALLRDVPYSEYGSNPIAAAAAADMTSFGADAKVAKTNVGVGQNNGVVTPQLLFRGLTPGDRQGPYLSQFFYQGCNFGANNVSQMITTARPGVNYMTDFGEWLAIQNGAAPSSVQAIDPSLRYMRQGRDIGQWVHMDVLFQAYFQAFLVLAGANAPVDDNNPYRNNPTQDAFGTFGGPHIAALVSEAATRALKAVWYQKWFVHRRPRPEVFAARVDRTAYHGAGYPVHADILNDVTSASRLGGYLPAGNALLPMAFPEGSPTHPAYGAGHATVAGACVTILKAWFKETTKLVDIGLVPLEPDTTGTVLSPYTGADAGQLTVGGELNKIASNVALGRNTAGVHWRSDGTESLKLGETLAIGLLRDQRALHNETFNGFSLTKFDGTTITV
jgi:membrane-associated phospholipid phosphatase